MNNFRDHGKSGVAAAFRHAWERSRGSLSLVIVGVCVAFFVLTAFLDRTGLVSRSQVFSFLGFSYIGVVHHFWFHQFLTAPLLHGSISHLLFNMLALWMLGPGVEKSLGLRRYIFLSILCAVSGLLGFLLFSWGTGNIAIGYSGVIYGILVAQAIFFPDAIVSLFAFFPLKMKHAVILLGAIELYLTLSPEKGGIAHAAHLFGAVAAFGYLTLIRRGSLGKRTPPQERATMKKSPQASRHIWKRRPTIPKKL